MSMPPLSVGGFQESVIELFVAVSKIGSSQAPGIFAAIKVTTSEDSPKPMSFPASTLN